MVSGFAQMTSSPNFFDVFFVSLVKLTTGPNFMSTALLLTGSGVITISFYEGLASNPEIGNTPSEFCPIASDWSK